MKRIRRNRWVASVLAVWLFAGGMVPAARAASRDAASVDARADASTTTAAATGCPHTVSCGIGCTATFATGFCLLAVKWRGAVKIGAVQIGPALDVDCNICECWYIYTNALGNKIFKRNAAMRCGAVFDGITIVE